MRHSPIIFKTLRTAIDDVELGDVLIPAGTFVFANTAAANRDPAIYDQPDRLDITRCGAPAMLTLGGGVQAWVPVAWNVAVRRLGSHLR